MTMGHVIWYLILAVLCTSVFIDNVEGICSANQFENSSGKCVNCSRCPNNMVYKRVCQQYEDTVCQTWNELLKHDNFFDFLSKSSNNISKSEPKPRNLQEYKSDSDQWKNMAFSLIGVLCFLVIVATIIVFVTCHKFFGMFHYSKSTNRSATPDTGDMGGEYVVIHRRPYIPLSVNEDPPETEVQLAAQTQNIPCQSYFNEFEGNAQMSTQVGDSSIASNIDFSHPISRSSGQSRRSQPLHRQGYRPQRRLLNDYCDDVFESDDSGGSKSGHRGILQPIPETPDKECMSNQDHISKSKLLTSDSKTHSDCTQDGVNMDFLRQNSSVVCNNPKNEDKDNSLLGSDPSSSDQTSLALTFEIL